MLCWLTWTINDLWGTFVRLLAATIALAFVTATSAGADDPALTEQEIEGLQNAVKAVECTVADNEIEADSVMLHDLG